jgi:hypothetical protein
VEALRAGLRPGKRYTPTSTGLEAQLGGRVVVWEQPEDGVFYDCGVDVAEGASPGADWTVLSVWRRDTLVQVAECRIHLDPATLEFVDLVYWLCLCYNTAQMIPDITAGWANLLMNEMQARGFSNIWRRRRRDDAREASSNRLGFTFTHRDKNDLVTNAAALVRQGAVTVRSTILLDEMSVYLNLGVEEWGAAPGHHDDAITAAMLALRGARDEGGGRTALPVVPKEAKPEPWLSHDIAEDLRSDTALAMVDSSPWEAR